MDVAATVKRVPKWAWVASAGVAGGVLFIRHRQNSGTSTSTTDTSASDTDQTDGTFPASGVLSSTQGVGDSGDGSSTGSSFSSELGDLGTLLTTFFPFGITGNPDPSLATPAASVTGDTGASASADTSTSAAGTLPATAGGGGAPTSGATIAAPAPQVVATNPVAPANPEAGATGSTGSRGTAAATPTCGGEFPFLGPNGCYKVAVSNGKRWHLYASGLRVEV